MPGPAPKWWPRLTYTLKDNLVTLEMTTEDYEQLLLLLRYAAGRFYDKRPIFYQLIRFVNDLNATNPNFTPYAIPAEYETPPR